MENEFEKGFMAGFLINYRRDDDKPKPSQKSWTYPSNWLDLPEPADNQIVMLVDNRGGSVHNDISYNIELGLYRTNATKIEWGDGTYTDSGNAASHTYEPGSGHKTKNSEQWIVTITFDKGADKYTQGLYSLGGSSTDRMFVLAIKIGNTEYMTDQSEPGTGGSLDCDYTNLQYAKICRGELYFQIRHAYCLRKVELNENITKIPYQGFYYAYSLIDINLENITEIGEYGFFYCYELDVSGKMPKLKTIGTYGLAYTRLSNFNFPCLETIGQYGISNCFNLTEINLKSESLKTIGPNAITNCYALQTIDLPYVTEIGNWAFGNNYSLKTVNLPLATKIGVRAFIYSYLLESVNLPLATTIGDNCFSGNYSLKTVDIRSCTDAGTNLFEYCYNLDYCVLPAGTDASTIVGNYLNKIVEIEYV